jgi:hypothetical protein
LFVGFNIKKEVYDESRKHSKGYRHFKTDPVPDYADESVVYVECQYCLDNGTGACQGYGC